MPFPFSSKTVGYLIDAIATGQTTTSMGTLFLKAEVETWVPETYRNKEDRAQQLLANLRSETTSSVEAVAGAKELARLVLVAGKPKAWSEPAVWWAPLKTAVAADGWEFDEQTDIFVTGVPGSDMVEEVTRIDTELRRRGWTTAAGHYKEAVEGFADGRWASANGQLRAFFESLIREAGGKADGTAPGQVQAAVDALADEGRLLRNEAEFIRAQWRMLHPNGSHPGLSDEDESRFRLLALTGYARFLLSRLPDAGRRTVGSALPVRTP